MLMQNTQTKTEQKTKKQSSRLVNGAVGLIGFAGFQVVNAFIYHNPWYLFWACLFVGFTHFRHWNENLKYLGALGAIGLILGPLGVLGIIKV
jgi:hypothetical protein